MQLLKGHTKRVSDIAFSPDGRYLVSSAIDDVRIWDTRTGESNVLVRSPGWSCQVRFVPDGNHVLVRPGSGTLELWSVTGRKKVVTLLRTSTYNGGIAVARGAGLVAANERASRPFANVVYGWDTATWERRVLFRTTENCSFSGLAFDPTGTRLAITTGVIDVPTGKRILDTRFPGDTFAWSPTAPILASAGYGPMLHLYNTDTGQPTTTLQLERKHVQDFAFSPDGTALAAVSNDETVRIWDTRDWKERSGFAWGIGQLKCLAFAPDGMRAACGSHRGTILIWDWE
jgi:WD40 repeat protein